MKKVFKLVAAGCLMFALTGCKKVSPEAQALMDVIKTAEQNEEPTYKEFSDIQNQYGALTEEVQKEVTNFPDYLNKARLFSPNVLITLVKVRHPQRCHSDIRDMPHRGIPAALFYRSHHGVPFPLSHTGL